MDGTYIYDMAHTHAQVQVSKQADEDQRWSGNERRRRRKWVSFGMEYVEEQEERRRRKRMRGFDPGVCEVCQPLLQVSLWTTGPLMSDY